MENEKTLAPSNGGGIPTDATSFAESLGLFEYASSANGHQIISQILQIIQNQQKASIDVTADQQKRQIEFQLSTWKRWSMIQAVVIISAMVSCTVLVCFGKMDGGVLAGLIGSMVGYVFGRKQG